MHLNCIDYFAMPKDRYQFGRTSRATIAENIQRDSWVMRQKAFFTAGEIFYTIWIISGSITMQAPGELSNL